MTIDACKVIFSLAVTLCIAGKSFSKLEVSIPQCCRIGSNWGKEGLKCGQYPAPILGVPESEQKTCLSTVVLCCERTREEEECKRGIDKFKTEKDCPPRNESSSFKDLEERCCESCRLGKIFGESKTSCTSEGIKLDENSEKAFEKCCFGDEKKSAKLETEPRSGNPDGTIDYENYDEYGVPTPRLDNLCDLLPGQLCAHICVPTPGSYYCKCNPGYVLMEDQKTCQRERTKPKHPTASPPVLIPNPEKPVPLHKPKRKPEKLKADPGKSCKEDNPCEQQCTDTERGYKCSCLPGYELGVDRKSCQDIDECLDNIHVCDPESETCINQVGGYNCAPRENSKTTIPPTTTEKTETTTLTTTTTTMIAVARVSQEAKSNCSIGYQPDFSNPNRCVDIDECDYDNNPEVCDPNQICINTPGSYECRCKIGYQQEQSTRRCVDINECQTQQHSCAATQRCDNTLGSYQCIRFTGCGTGYTLNAQNGLCEDDDECTLGTDNCRFLGPNYQCRNTLGSFRCEKKRCQPGDDNCIPGKQCQLGYHEDDSGNCIDTDECKLGTHNCNPYSEQCMNRIGGFECRKFLHCPNGYEATARGCSDVDECATNKHDCKGSQCVNHNGGYTCVCPSGFQTNGNRSCEDVNECNLYLCPFNSDCQNTPGSYRCVCKSGFRNVDSNNCEDIDECALTPGICQHNCINVFGSYRCTCHVGFKLHENNRSCSDLDECEMFKDQRLCIGECVNSPGSFTCRCPRGYILGQDGRTCQDVDECIKNPCKGQDEVCLNTRGSFRCNSIKCPPDYVKDAEHKNRCKRSKAYCREDDMNCLQRPLTYSFNFITFVSMLPIPPSGHLDLFTMRGPLWSGTESQFSLDLLSARVPTHIVPASKDYFRLRNSGWNQAVIALVRPIPGPQELELQLTMNLYHNGLFGGVGVAKLFIHVSEYEF